MANTQRVASELRMGCAAVLRNTEPCLVRVPVKKYRFKQVSGRPVPIAESRWASKLEAWSHTVGHGMRVKPTRACSYVRTCSRTPRTREWPTSIDHRRCSRLASCPIAGADCSCAGKTGVKASTAAVDSRRGVVRQENMISVVSAGF